MAREISKVFIVVVMLAGVETVFDSIAARAQPQSTALPPRAILGVKLREPTPQEAQSLGLQASQGALVEATVPNGHAEKAGLRPGDLILSLDRQAVGYAAQAVQIIGSHNPGDVVEIVLLRSGRQQMLKARLAAPGDSASIPPPTTPAQRPVPDPATKANETLASSGSDKTIR